MESQIMSNGSGAKNPLDDQPSRVERVTSDPNQLLADDYSNWKKRLNDMASTELAQLEAAGRQLVARGEALIKRAEQVVKERPLVSLAVVAGISALAVGVGMRLASRARA